MEEKLFWDKVYWLTFLFSMLVVWVHSFNAELFLGVTEAAARVDKIERILGDSLGQIAVPGFFMVSSYLFYRGFNWSRLIPKWSSRIKSLLLPYLLWNFLYYMGYVAVTRLPFVSGVVGKSPVPFNGAQIFDALVNYAYNPVFWYLFQLILLVALAPLIYVVMGSSAAGAGALAVMALGLWNNWSTGPLNLDALFYTCVAAYVSLHRDSWGHGVEARTGYISNLASSIVLALSFALLWCLGQPGGVLWARPFLTVCFRLWGVCAAVLAVKMIRLPRAREWMKHNFFLYAIHFAWVRLLNKAGAMILPGSAAGALAVFFLMPAMMVVVSTWIGIWMRRVCPGVYKVLSGGR